MKIKSGSALDWEMAKKAAEHIVKMCEDAFYVPPEAVGQHTAYVAKVCGAMDSIVDALKLRHGSGEPPKRVEPAT
jgi:hypothetical protein